MKVTPYYNKPPQRGLYEHYRKIAAAVPMPMLLYNVPGRTGVDIAPQTVVELAKIGNIIGIKEASTFERIAELAAIFGVGKKREFAIYCGNDDLNARAFAAGYIDGVISVTANVAPQAVSAVCRAGLAGDGEQALTLDAPLAALHDTLFIEANPIPAKWALARMGKIKNGIRLPLMPLAAEHHSAVENALRTANLINP